MLSMGPEQSEESIWGTWKVTGIGVQNSCPGRVGQEAQRG